MQNRTIESDKSTKVTLSNMVTKEEKKLVEDLYDCSENPISYMIEPKGSIKFTKSDEKITKKDFEKTLA